MKIPLISFLLILSCVSVVGQNYEKVWFDKTDSANGYYSVIKPNGSVIQGAVVLFDGYGGDAVSFLSETKIQNIAFANQLLTIGIPCGELLLLDDAHAAIIKKILDEVVATYHLRPDRIAMGGFSAGGTTAIRYTELSYQYPDKYPIQPHALFDADAPVDLLGLYEQSKRELSQGGGGWWLSEDKMIIDSLDALLGPPTNGLARYRQVSTFTQSDTTPGNELFLRTVPYRTYHDVDVSWLLKNRGRSLYGSNMLNASELIRRLNQAGNTDAEFMASKTPGIRSNGQRHPHSWNIIDETDLVLWIKQKLDFYPGDPSRRYSYGTAGWQTEEIPFPMDFAPGLAYNGYEDLRFAPGFSNAASPEKWAYTFVWWLDGHIQFSETSLKQDLETYYSGLTQRRAVADRDDPKNYFPATAHVKKITTGGDDLATFTGTVHLYDAQVTKKPADLYVKIHVKPAANKQRSIVLFEIAGFPQAAAIWKQLDQINAEFHVLSESIGKNR